MFCCCCKKKDKIRVPLINIEDQYESIEDVAKTLEKSNEEYNKTVSTAQTLSNKIKFKQQYKNELKT
jgi:hypothetical protein